MMPSRLIWRALVIAIMVSSLAILLALQVAYAAPPSGTDAPDGVVGAAPPEAEGNGPELAALMSIDKSVVATSQASTSGDIDVTIGEIVTYRIELVVREGQFTGAVLTDTIDSGLAFVDCLGISASSLITNSINNSSDFSFACTDPTNPAVGGPGVEAGRFITFTFGDIRNRDSGIGSFLTSERIFITYTAVVLNSDNNDRGDLKLNKTRFSWTGGTLGSGAVSDLLPPVVHVVEPTFYLTKTAGKNIASRGEEIDFYLSLNRPLLAINDTAGFELVMTDTVPAGMTYVPGSLTLLGGSTPPASVVQLGNSMTATWTTIPKNAGASFVYSATVDYDAMNGQVFVNHGGLCWTSLPGSVGAPLSAYNPLSVERTCNPADPGQDNDYYEQGSAIVLIAFPDLSITKTDYLSEITPGSTASYEIVATNSGLRRADNVVITETVPAECTFNAAASSPGWSCADGAPAGSVCTFDVGTLWQIDILPPLVRTVTVTFGVTLNDPVAADVDLLTNTASVGYDGEFGPDPTPVNNTAQDLDTVVAHPDLAVTKAADAGAALPGAIVHFTLYYTNTGDIGAANVTLTETIPANSTFVAAESSAGWTCVPDGSAGSVCTLNVGTVAGAGGSGLAVFAVQMPNPILPGDPATLSNTASIADDGQNGADADTSDNSQTIEVPVVYTIFNKVEWQPTVASGYNLRYTIVVQNTGVTALNDVIITDTIPGATTFVEATAPVVSNIPPNLYGGWGSPGGAWNGNHTIVWNVGAVPAGSYASVKVHVHVLSGVAAGTIITNTAAMTGGGRGPAEAQVAATVIAPTIRPPTHTPTPTPTPPVSGLCPANPVLRVEVGSTTPYTDTAGYLWRSDQAYTAGVNDWGFTGGSDTFLTAAGIAGTLDDPLYQTERWWIGNGGYRFAVPNGLYNVTIKFAEVYPWAKPGNRVFTVTVEGSVVLGRLDVIRAAPGANTAYDKTFVATVNDGILNVDVIAERGSPALKAIALWKLEPCTGTVLPTPTSTPTPTATATPAPLCAPLRVDAGSGVPYSDSGGATWLADQTFASGSAVGGYAGASGVFSTGAAIANTTDPALYRTHRWFEGNGSYLFTVPNGRYDVTLKFAEIYPWTPVGGRVFNVVIEGNMALTHVDILATAGHNRAHDATFTVQVSDGMLNVEFLRERGNPAVNAILVTPLDCVAPTPRQ